MSKRIQSIKVIRPGSQPDVDSDFNTQAREQTINHVRELYGNDNVSAIGTFQTLAAKSSFKTMCTIYQVPFAQAQKISDLIPNGSEGVDVTLKDIYDPKSDIYNSASDFRNATAGENWIKIIEGARALEGRAKATSKHPCGIVISSQPLMNTVPLLTQKDGVVATQWEYSDLESLGLIKMDFLGLDTVDLIQHTVETIAAVGKTPPNMLDLINGDMDDPKTFAMLAKGETIGTFQLASPGVQDLLKRIRPTSVHDIIATTALYRPGPMGMQSHIKYADRKNGKEAVDFIHPDFNGSALEEILGSTYGICVYQEQVVRIANQISGMTLQEGDDLRKAMGKKIISKMLSIKPKFISGGVANGFSEEAMELLWNTCEEFAKYGFNLCVSGNTVVVDEMKKELRIRDLYKSWERGEQEVKIMSMWEDGEIKPHAIRRIVSTGKRFTYTVTTETGRSIEITKEHRLLTTNGYGSILDGKLQIGSELIVDETEYGADSGIREERLPKGTPNKRLKGLRNDPIWVQKFAESIAKIRASEGEKSWKQVTQISDGRFCDSIVEAAAAEYLLARNVDFELHKIVENLNSGSARVSNFYCNGIYFEMDALCRGEQWFQDNKYGAVPFVYLTPYNFVDKIDEAFSTVHSKNGDKIVSIVKSKTKRNVYDIEMELEGPSNFVANKIISHNSHSVAYGINAYQTAYLKANYPLEFMSTLISQNVNKKAKILTFLQEASRMGIKVGSVNVNISENRAVPDLTGNSGFDVIYGFAGLDSVSKDIADLIIQERNRNGEFTSVQDMIQRCYSIGVSNRKVYENIAKAGGFDTFGVSRRAVVENLPGLLSVAKTNESKGASLFDMFGESAAMDSSSIDLKNVPEYSHVEKLRLESDVVGLYLTGHPLGNAGPGLSKARTATVSTLFKAQQQTDATLTVAVTDIATKITRRGKSMMLTMDDGTGYINANVSREIIKSIDKKNARSRVRKLYENGESEVPEDMEALAVAEDLSAMEDIQKNGVYVVNLTFRPSRDESPYGARVNSIRPLYLSDDGSLPIRMRFLHDSDSKEKMLQLSRKLPKAIANRNPGKFPIYIAVAPKGSPSLNESNELYQAAIDEIRASAGRSSEKKAEKSSSSNLLGSTASKKVVEKNENKRVWPPKLSVSSHISTGFTESVVDGLVYEHSGFFAAKTKQTELDIEKYLGNENYDFGVLNSDIGFED